MPSRVARPPGVAGHAFDTSVNNLRGRVVGEVALEGGSQDGALAAGDGGTELPAQLNLETAGGQGGEGAGGQVFGGVLHDLEEEGGGGRLG